MVKKQTQTSDIRGSVAFGSGLAATLLLLAAFQGSVPALLLAYLSPLPLMIATIGFGHMTGLGAVLAGVITLVALLVAANPQDVSAAGFAGAGADGLIFLICEGLPAWWLARLASVSRRVRILPFLPEPPETAEDGSRLSLVIVTAAAFAFLVVSGTLAIMALGHEDFATLADKVAANIRPVLRQEAGADLLSNTGIEAFARFLARALPAIAAGVIFMIYLLNLWLAGRVTQISQRLQVPWPNVAREFRVPRLLALVFVAAAALVYYVGGPIGVLASLVASILGVAFALQGLAVIHVVTLGLRLRNNLLILLYVFVVPLTPWSLAPFTLLGLFEAGFSLRDRKYSVAVSPKTN
jgi:hypothetical protein